MPVSTEKIKNHFLVIIRTDNMPRQHVACFFMPRIQLNLEGFIININNNSNKLERGYWMSNNLYRKSLSYTWHEIIVFYMPMHD